MASIFTKIINGEIPCHKIAESEDYFAFLDISPLAKGHTLVVPKKEVDYIFDIDDKDLGGMLVFAKKSGKSTRKHCGMYARRFVGDWYRSTPRTHPFGAFSKRITNEPEFAKA